ncbi:MAG: hypothetical protein ACREL7_05515 [Longimicrobiales bacterium]
MSPVAWIAFALTTAVAIAASVWIYRRREAAGRGRAWLAVLRAIGLALLLLLLFDPDLPGTTRNGGPAARILLDHSLSMGLAGGNRSHWQAAQAAIEREAAAARQGVMLFGDAPQTVAAGSIDTIPPGAQHSLLLPAIQAMAEAGVREVIVVSDGGIEDAEEVVRWLPRLGVEARVVRVGDVVSNRGIVELSAPAWAEADTPIEIRVGIASIGEAGDSILVSALDRGESVAQAMIAAPAEGRIGVATLRFDARAPEAGSLARYDIMLQGGDAAADDDVRSVYVDVSDEPGGIAFISFRPDWEPRFLQPVLERALGLPIRAFLRMNPATWVRGGIGLRTATRATEQDVREAVAAADLVVLHAYGENAPAWIHEQVRAIRRLLILPAGPTGTTPIPVPLGPLVAADWYLSANVPSSPIAHLLAGLETGDVPPLPALRLVDEPEGAWAPVFASRGRRGAAYPIALGGETGRRRWAIALGDGFWRWAFRGGVARDAYERIWSALAGWLVEDQTIVAGGEAVLPVRRVVPRASNPRWTAAGPVPDSFRVTLTAEDGTATLDTTMVADSDTLSAPVVRPGHYVYNVRAFAGTDSMTGTGPLTVESFSPEFTRPRVDGTRLETPVVTATSATRGPRVPLRTEPWPWAVLITILCVEWILRRRWGLR